MTMGQTDPERGLPDPELWEAPRRISERELAADWGVERASPSEKTEEDR